MPIIDQGSMSTNATTAQAEDFDRVHAVLLRCVRKACPRNMLGEAEDIAQAAATRLLARMAAADAPLDLRSSYLWKVANHAVIDEIRKRGRRRERASPHLDESAAHDGDPDLAHDRARMLAGVRDCLDRATPQRRAALGLHLQGLGLPDVARALGCDRKRADNLVYRGLARLRACLVDKGLRP